MATDPSAQPDVAKAKSRVVRRFVFGAVAVVLVVGVATLLYWTVAFKTYHFQAVVPGVLYRSGNDNIADFAHGLARGHVKTDVALIDDQEIADPNKPQFQQEMDFTQAHRITYIRLPVKLGGWPSSADVQAFLAAATNSADQPVLVHCAQGVRRTGMMVAAYEMSVMGYDKQKAIASIDSFGHSQRTIDDVKKFIEVYDPTTRTVTQSLAQSTE